MVEIGYKLSSEEHGPNDLVRYAKMAEDAGFDFAMASDHYFPWTDAQGQSPFVWATLGGVSQATKRIHVGTAVTCPILRVHPAIIAQAAATVAAMFEGRFVFAVGTGENLNEHILGEGWPEPKVRLAMFEEAIGILRKLWTGDLVSHHGAFYVVEQARIFTRPAAPPPLVMAADHPHSATLAGRLGDGLMSTTPSKKIVETFEGAGGKGKPKYIEVTVAWADSEAEGRAMATRRWPIAGMPGPLLQQLPLPKYFEEVATLVTEEHVAGEVPCGPDPKKHLEAIQKAVDAGYDHVFVHQIGHDQAGFFRFYERNVLPALTRTARAA